MAMAYSFGILATGVSGAILYSAVNSPTSLKSLQAKLGGAEVKLKFYPPQGKSDEVKGTVTVPKSLMLTPITKTEFENDLNQVDGSVVKANIKVKSWSYSYTEDVDEPDHFGCVVQNDTKNPMFAQLFQGFKSSDDNAALAVAWQASTAAIYNGSQAQAEWDIQYCMVAGQIGAKFSVSIKPINCNLGDKALVTYDHDSNSIVVTKTGSDGPAGTITFKVGNDFPEDSWLIGFGVIDPDTGKAKASGVTPAFSAATFSFTPYQKYSVNLVNHVTTNLYKLDTVSDYLHFEFSGTSNRWATCVFENSGWAPVVYTKGPPATDKDEEISPVFEKVQINTMSKLKQVILQY